MGKFNYAVLGAGRQGQAIVYDLIRFGEPEKIILVDENDERLKHVKSRISCLFSGKKPIHPIKLALPHQNLLEILKNTDVCIGCLPFYLNGELAEIALEAKVNFCDLGGNTDIVWQELALDTKAKKAGISIIPDCGLMPGAGNILAAYAINRFDECGKTPIDEIRIYVGGLPQNENLPLGYRLTFSADGLINEYLGKANILRNGEIIQVDALSEPEEIFEPSLNISSFLEAFITSGGTSTAPWSFQEKVKNYTEKTIRYTGHLEKILVLKELGFFETNPIEIRGKNIAPQELTKALLEKKLGVESSEDNKDIVIFILEAKRKIGGIIEEILKITWEQCYDETTGFTAMEQTTGFSASIVAIMQAKKEVPVGALPPEKAIDPKRFLKELRKRGFKLSIYQKNY